MSWETYEISEICDGWILKFNRETKEIEWRDHYVVERLSKKVKKNIIGQILNLIENESKSNFIGSMRKRPGNQKIS